MSGTTTCCWLNQCDIRLINDEKPYSEPVLKTPRKTVADRLLAQSSEMVVAIDVETHDWLPEKHFGDYVGEFGFFTTRTDKQLDYARMVALGWGVGSFDSDGELEVSKERLVKPEGFQISAKAEGAHKIPQSKAVSAGLPLAEVLAELARDLFEAYDRGARLVAHQLEFDAGVVKRELARCELFATVDGAPQQLGVLVVCCGIVNSHPLVGTVGRRRQRGLLPSASACRGGPRAPLHRRTDSGLRGEATGL